MRNFWGLLLILFVLQGCASLSREECELGDWENVGKEDALSGFASSRFKEHVKACKRHKVRPSVQDYAKGYEVGRTHYCTTSNAFRVGRNGYRYEGICPISLAPDFEAAYGLGRAIHDKETAIASAQFDLDEIADQLSDMRDLPDEDIKWSRLQRLKRERRSLRQEIMRLERQKERALVEAELFLREKETDL